MAHKTGFTAETLGARLIEAGLRDVEIFMRPFALVAMATKSSASREGADLPVIHRPIAPKNPSAGAG